MQPDRYRVTLSMPCWGRPERTKRAIECIVKQYFQGWEALVVGDGCPHFQKLLESDWLKEMIDTAEKGGNSLVCYNLPTNHGGCGYHITNLNIQAAKGEYLLFMGNDDVIQLNHFSNYHSAIENTGLDYIYFNSFLHPINQKRITKYAPSEIGHSEIIVKTELAKQAPPHTNKYGHDWDFLKFISENGRGKKILSSPTYYVMSLPNFGTRDKIN